MAGINLKLKVAATDSEYAVELPRDVLMSHLIPAIKAKLDLPITDMNGQKIIYYMQTEGGIVLQENDTLNSVGIQEGCWLIFAQEIDDRDHSIEVNLHVWQNQDPILLKVPEEESISNFLKSAFEIVNPLTIGYASQIKKYHLLNETGEDLFENNEKKSLKSVGIRPKEQLWLTWDLIDKKEIEKDLTNVIINLKVVPKNKYPIECLPLHVPIHRLISILIERYGLKKTDRKGQQIQYFLKIGKNDRMITNTETLYLAGAHDNMDILLIDPAQGDNPPKVFICHASEDEKRAKRLSQQLAESGIIPWLDKVDIPPGVIWNARIEKAINEEIDYFVILHSEYLVNKYKGFVNKEIKWAFKVLEYYRPGLLFIIPATIDDCPLLDILKHIQAIDLSQKGGFGRLVDTIKQDYQNRHGDVRLNRN